MSYYTEDDLRDFVKYSKDYVAGLKADENDNSDPVEIKKLVDLTKVITSMYFNAMVFESFIKGNSVREYVFSSELDQLPLHMNDEGMVSQVIVKWRLQRNK
jgi:hypothetical protein